MLLEILKLHTLQRGLRAQVLSLRLNLQVLLGLRAQAQAQAPQRAQAQAHQRAQAQALLHLK